MTRLFITLLIVSVLALAANATKGKSGASDSLRFREKTVCRKFSSIYQVDELFAHPTRDCIQCRCCKTGKVKCFKKKCDSKPAECGMAFQEATDIDGCCTKCNSTCEAIKQLPKINCPGDIVYYDNEDTSAAGCTGVCGCNFRGHIVPNGIVDNPKVVHSCEQCECANGEVTCTQQAMCPQEKLHCVNPAVNPSTCMWHCPEGPTCWKRDEVLFANRTYQMDGKFCACILDPWWPYAACGNQGHEAVFEKMLQDEMCMAIPISPSQYND